ncbi:histidine phosphatase family protein [Methylobacterium sp. E-016]|uniref:histidine phosphatase family protein n=1 Tax=Methylobacterium sp. E-016 TaxID=2836556 RepID=UPI001FB94810|nr:histidine phosphatase family protein [Methylobacterium sp. E-016]MCJ2075281.1 histidine phosphatase family protein [Methylobacterium sp. E-016]
MSFLTVMLARHAEKPGGEFPGKGSTFKGTRDEKSLVMRGWQRAGAWAALFSLSDATGDYPPPNVIYAAKPEPVAEGASFSHRPWETAVPVAKRLHLDPNTNYGVTQEADLVKEITAMTGVALVFWEHKAIAETIIPALLKGQELPGIPTKWDGERFDVVLRFDRAVPDAPWSFRQLSPRLLDGDTDQPFKKRT